MYKYNSIHKSNATNVNWSDGDSYRQHNRRGSEINEQNLQLFSYQWIRTSYKQRGSSRHNGPYMRYRCIAHRRRWSNGPTQKKTPPYRKIFQSSFTISMIKRFGQKRLSFYYHDSENKSIKLPNRGPRLVPIARWNKCEKQKQFQIINEWNSRKRKIHLEKIERTKTSEYLFKLNCIIVATNVINVVRAHINTTTVLSVRPYR